MVFSIEAEDSEFAVSTGNNVNTANGQSRFDHPPNASKDLVITAVEGDSDPRLFEVGDTYDISWGGAGGGGTILNATVVRSDDPSDGGSGGVLVFEGVDENGDTAQVVWTPGDDLEDWYWAQYRPSSRPEFRTTDQNSSFDYEVVCFEKTVRLATPRGWQPVSSLRVGQTVCTWDGARRVVRWVGRKTVAATENAAPIRFAPGTIGNAAPIKLSPQHRVMIASPQAELHFGASEVLVPAIGLVDGRRVRRVQRQNVTYVHILLDRHDILIAEGAPCESLLPGDRSGAILSAHDRADIRRVLGPDSHIPARPILRRREAATLVASCRVPLREQAVF
ncbi:Hint domain-containing protein [Aestuariicoccus sp. MJ-SS9]|uniref:Hint domain-containing protein n=1 Tax=Aestuariicoccus sp. MJ-SS9 TaxID=3079855 RepID=UPI00290D7F63|nr:Hint domain-containing protein [Aestuariicoccus sp. MJ-SS9]MDU8909890.1 Hint domain-containing protein [Aestuariicoccus sp. MJ-SS9]